MAKDNDAVYDFSTSNIKLPSWWGQDGKDFGSFSPDCREYIITTPHTPRPWLNYLGNDKYGVVFGNHGQGFSWYRAMTARVSRYTTSEYVPREPDSGRAVYLKINGDEKLVSLAASPENAAYKCVHGLGYSIVSCEYCGLKAQWKIFVPVDDSVEIWQVKVVNTSSAAKSFSLMPLLEWQLGQYGYNPPCSYKPYTDLNKDVTVQFHQDINTFVAVNKASQPLKYGGFFKSVEKGDNWLCERSGLCGDNIISLKEIRFTNRSSENEPAVSAIDINITLAPGQEKECVFVAGVFEDKTQLEGLLKKYDRPVADEEFQRLAAYWDGVINDSVYVNTPDEQVNLWCNVRLKHLLHQTKRWTRGLDRGYRDILQDIRGFTTINAAAVRECLLQTLSFQYSDGRAVRQWSQVGTNHDLRDYSDSPVWIADALTTYIKETGDKSILNEQVAYFDKGAASVYEHNLCGIFGLFADRGSQGLCRIRHGDWNDALEGIGKQGKAQGVWLSMSLYWAMSLTRELAAFIKDEKTADKLADAMEELHYAVNRYGWCEKWYAYAIDDSGKFVGSPDDAEGRLHLNAQTFAVFTGIAKGQRAKMCMDAVSAHLDTPIGPLLVWPCYKNSKVGRIWRMEPGTFENGSMYFHGAAFKMLADVAIDDVDAAVKTFRQILPSNPRNPLSRSTIEPYALGNYYCGRDNKFFGLNIYSHFTGSYSWLLKCLVEKIIGIEAGYKGLTIAPKLPADWNGVEVKRKFRGRFYNIAIKRSRNGGGLYDIYLNGLAIAQSVQSIFVGI